jgi:hypothetical protein
MERNIQVGFSQRIQLGWLERTADHVLAGESADRIKAALQNQLLDQLSVGNNPERGNRDKAITILMKIWVNPQKALREFRDEGLEFLRYLPKENRIAVHWGICMAVYPFFALVAEEVGRLLRLQGALSAAQVQRRVREKLGERETVHRAARRILRCFIDWGVIVDSNSKGMYQDSPTRIIDHDPIAAWLYEAVLISGIKKTMPIGSLRSFPSLFPFTIPALAPASLEKGTRLDVYRHGLDEDMVRLIV